VRGELAEHAKGKRPTGLTVAFEVWRRRYNRGYINISISTKERDHGVVVVVSEDGY
jgi:hypothetical protein